MITAGLVILACGLGKGCIETSTQYYNSNPTLQQTIRAGQKLSYKYLGQFTVEYTIPLMLISLDQSATIKVNKYTAYTFSKKQQNLNFNIGF